MTHILTREYIEGEQRAMSMSALECLLNNIHQLVRHGGTDPAGELLPIALTRDGWKEAGDAILAALAKASGRK